MEQRFKILNPYKIMLKLGNLRFDVPFFQAPLSGYSDRAMRVLARKYGAPLTYTGVMLDKIPLHRKAFNRLYSRPGADEDPVVTQLLGSSPETMAVAVAEGVDSRNATDEKEA